MLAVAGDVREPAGPASAQRQGRKLLGSKGGDLGSHFPQDLLWVTGHEATGSGCVAYGEWLYLSGPQLHRL